MLFLLAMEPLQLLFKKAMQTQLINKLTHNYDSFRVSLYADDAALFLKPSKDDLDIMNCIMQLFADASGLITNLRKTQTYPIRCDHLDLSFLSDASIPISEFPCSYLGLPLHFRRSSKAILPPLVLKIGGQDGRGIASPTLEENCLSRQFFPPCLLISYLSSSLTKALS
jgi:hypothetical protein